MWSQMPFTSYWLKSYIEKKSCFWCISHAIQQENSLSLRHLKETVYRSSQFSRFLWRLVTQTVQCFFLLYEDKQAGLCEMANWCVEICVSVCLCQALSFLICILESKIICLNLFKSSQILERIHPQFYKLNSSRQTNYLGHLTTDDNDNIPIAIAQQ